MKSGNCQGTAYPPRRLVRRPNSQEKKDQTYDYAKLAQAFSGQVQLGTEIEIIEIRSEKDDTMKKTLVYLWILILVAIGLTGNAGATQYSYDFSTMGFSNGQYLEGMTLDFSAVTSETDDLRYYTDYGGGIGTGDIWGSTADIYIDFSIAINEISFTAGDGEADEDAFAVTLYEFGTGTPIGTWSTPIFGGSNEPEWYTLNISAPNIGRVLFDPGNSGVLPGVIGKRGGLIIVEMGYTPVPEPATILLLGSGLAGAIALRKKFKTYVDKC